MQCGSALAGGAHAELEVLRRRLEPARLVVAEAVLTGQHDGEAPAGAGLAERAFGTRKVMKREIELAVIATVPSVGVGRVLEALAEALHLDQPAPGERRARS